MHSIFTTLFLSLATLSASAQPELIDKAIISTKTSVTIIDKEAEPLSQPIFDRWGNQITVLRPDDEKTILSTSYFRKDKLKTSAKLADSIIVHTVRDNSAQTTSTVTQFQKVVYYTQGATIPQGNQQDTIIPIIHLSRPTIEKSERTLFGQPLYITDAVLGQMQKSIDSTKLANGYDTAGQQPTVRIIYQEVEKKVAGYRCKRAVIMAEYPNGQTDQVHVWYNTEVKIDGLVATGDPAFAHGYLSPTKKWALLTDLKGFPMEFDMTLAPNRMVTVSVYKLDIKRKIVNYDLSLPIQTPPLAFQEAPQNGHLKTPGMQNSMSYINGQLLPVTIVKMD